MTESNDSNAPQQPDANPSAPPQSEPPHAAPPQAPQAVVYGPKPKSRSLAVAALILGICAVIVPGLGLLAGLVAIVFGILAIAKKTPGTALAAIGLVLGIIGPFGQIAIGVHLVSRARDDARRAVCAVNLNGMGKAIAMWQAENNDKWMDLYSEAGIAVPDSPGGDWGKANASSAGDIDDLDPDCNAQHWWLLCDAGTIAEAGFICPSDPNDPKTPQHTGGNTKGFGSWANLSYGIQPMLNNSDANPGRPGTAGQDGGMIVAGDRPEVAGGSAQMDKPNANHGKAGGNYLILNLSVKRTDWDDSDDDGAKNDIGYDNDNIYDGDGTVTGDENDSYLMYVDQDPETDDDE